ncbi:MAG: AI-2E family transporter, partial [Gammaproteobacteria bacterium]
MNPSDSDSNDKPSALTTLLAIAALVIVVAGLKAAQAVIVPFLLATFVAVVCAPALLWLEEHGLPRVLAMIVVIAGIVAAAFGFTALVSRSIRDFTRDLPVYKARMAEEFGAALQWLEARGAPATREEIANIVDPGASIQLAADVFNGFGSVLANAFLIFLTAVFILFETSTFPTKLRAIVDRPEQSMAEFAAFTKSLRRYLAIKSVVSMGTGASIAICLAL